MDDDDGRTLGIKQSRREIISVLNTMYHIGPLNFESLCGSLVHLELPDDECVKRDLTYLCEKGYVQWVNAGGYIPWKKRQYKLTARGNEFAENMISDPALEP